MCHASSLTCPCARPTALEDIAFRLQSRIQTIFPIHPDLAAQQPGGTSSTLPLPATVRNVDAVHFRRFEEFPPAGYAQVLFDLINSITPIADGHRRPPPTVSP